MVITWMQLQAAREAAGLTQAELAARLGVSQRTIVNWESGGVPRKSEYKVLDELGPYLEGRKLRAGLGRGIGKLIPSTSSNDVFFTPSTSAALTVKDASDEQLLNELLTRAKRRRKMYEGSAEPNVSGMTDDELSNLDLSKGMFDLAATHDTSTVEEQSHPDYEDESQDHKE